MLLLLCFREVKDASLQSEFKTNNDSVLPRHEKSARSLQEILLPASHGDFRLGAENFSKKLLYDEMIDIPSISCWKVDMPISSAQ